MKLSITRSSLLTALVAVSLAAALPFAIWELIQTGELYILSHRFLEDIIARLYGPGRLRFILQPLVAIVFGTRDGVKDARTGRPPFLRHLIFHKAERPGLLRSALASVRDLLAIAILLDVVSQLIIFRMVHPAAALLIGPVLIALPYASSRALANRASKWRSRRAFIGGSELTREQKEMSATKAVLRNPQHMKFFPILAAFVVVLALPSHNAAAQQPPVNSGFSFAVYGDSRSMMYLPFRSDQEAEARQVMAQVFELVLSLDRAKELVKKYVKLSYDPSTHELTEMVMPFITMSEITTLTFDKGWVTKASVEDVKLLPGVHRTMYEISGGEWVTRELVQDVISGRAKFLLSTGDLVWSGAQGSKPSENPYWRLVSDDLKQLPAPDNQMRAAGLLGRTFPAVGNHEVMNDPETEGLLSGFPYLKPLGVSDKNLIYKFDYNGARFIFLWTGKYNEHSPTAWGATRPTYEEQMKQLAVWLDEAKAAGIRKAFISFHNPAFCRSGFGAVPDAQNPHKLLAS